jgi:hypothetical protein
MYDKIDIRKLNAMPWTLYLAEAAKGDTSMYLLWLEHHF